MRRFMLMLWMIGLLTVLLPSSVYAATIVITPDNYTSFPNIFFERLGSASDFTSTTPAPALGTGAFFHHVTYGGDYTRISHLLLPSPIPLASAIFTYETLVDPLSTTTTTFFLNLYIGTAVTFGAPTPYCTFRLDFVPTGTIGSWTLHDAMDVNATYHVNSAPGCFSGTYLTTTTLGAFLTANPTSLIGGFAFMAGDSVSMMVGFRGYLDNITFGTAGNTTTWNFEPVSPAVSAAPATPATGCDVNTDPSIIVNPLPNITFCRVLVRDGAFVGNPGSVPQDLLNAGVLTAVEIYRFDESANSVQTFPSYQYFCFKGVGRFIYLDSRQAPRQQVEIPATIQEGFTCGWLPAPGTAVIIR